MIEAARAVDAEIDINVEKVTIWPKEYPEKSRHCSFLPTTD